MSIVQTVAPDQANGKVAQVYARMQETLGWVPNAIRLFSSSPDLLEQVSQQNAYYMQHPRLGFPLLALIRMLVSERNNCTYCIGLNESLLINRAGYTPEQIAAVKRDPANAPLAEKEKAMLLFVLKGTRAPKSVAKDDLNRLRELGWNDGDIVDGLYHGARNAAMNIMLEALKVENDF